MADDHGIHDRVSSSGHRRSIDWDVREVTETGSTNADLSSWLDSLSAGEAPGHVVLRTDHQTAGRGRLDRRWDAPPGSNLLVSLLFPDPPPSPQTVVQAVALAALDAVDSWVPTGDVSLKWPNDLLVEGRKLAGVLAQRHASGAVVVGIGLNVGWAPDGACRLADVVPADRLPTPAEVLDRLLDRLDALLLDGRLEPGRVVDGVRARMATLGSDVRVDLPGDRSATGRALELGDDGRLGVVVDGDLRWFDAGDVVHLRSSE